MPYINPAMRMIVEDNLQYLIENIQTFNKHDIDGVVNYCVTRILHSVYPPKYDEYNRAMGVLSCIQHEFYRRKVAPYEDAKMRLNGDVA
jgi:hypothetical protein